MKLLITFLLSTMSYLTMHAKVIIGDIFFTSINSFKITQSVENTSDTATVVLAKNYKQLAGKKVLDYIKAGQPITIQCGYNNNLQTEFTGYVKHGIGADYPLEIECDALYFLRQNNFIISERNYTLKQLLQRIAPNYTIECLDVQLGKVHFSNESTVQILASLKKDFGFYSRIYNNILHVGFAYDFNPSFAQKHEYIVGNNVRDISKLKYSTTKDFNTKVKIKINHANGKNEEVVYGMKDDGTGNYVPTKIGTKDDKVQDEKGTIKTYQRSHISTATAEQIAKAQLNKIIYSGYTGSVLGFCEPRTKAGDSLAIINEAIPDREGVYMIDKVELTYEDAKIERENFLSYRIS